MHRRRFTALTGITITGMLAGCQSNSEDNDNNLNDEENDRELRVLERDDLRGDGWEVTDESYTPFNGQRNEGKRFVWSLEEGSRSDGVRIDSGISTSESEDRISESIDSIQSDFEDSEYEINIAEQSFLIYREGVSADGDAEAAVYMRDGATAGKLLIYANSVGMSSGSLPVEPSVDTAKEFAELMYR